MNDSVEDMDREVALFTYAWQVRSQHCVEASVEVCLQTRAAAGEFIMTFDRSLLALEEECNLDISVRQLI